MDRSESMVERVALAIWKARGTAHDDWPDDGHWGAQHPQVKDWVLAEARAAIEAMREPNAAMLDSGVAFALCVSLGGDYRWSDYVRDKHAAMIDAALA